MLPFSVYLSLPRLVAAVLLLGTSVLAAQTPPPAASPATRDTRSESVELVQDASVAESVSRRTNVDFGSVRVDGQRSNTALSALSADQVLSVESTKVPTPDLDADAVGGLLRVTTRRAYDQTGRTLRGELSAGYDEMAERFTPDVSITYGHVFGRDNRFGFLGTVQYEGNVRAEEAIELDWNRPGTELQELEIESSLDRRRSVNFNGTLDLRLGPESFAFVRVDGSVAREDSLTYEMNFEFEDAPAVPASAGVLLTDATARRGARGGVSDNYDLTLSTGLTLKREEWSLEFKAGHTEQSFQSDRRFNFEYEQEGLSFLYRREEPAFPQLATPAGATPADPAQFRLNELEVSDEDSSESDSVASLDVARSNAFGARPGWLKGGAKIRLLTTDNDVANDIYGGSPAGARLGDAPFDGPNRTILDGRYRFDRIPSLDSLKRVFTASPGKFTLDADRTRGDTDPSIYEVSQHVTAAYGMASVGFGPTRVLAGVRVEQTDNEFTANQVIFDDNGRYEATLPAAADTSYTNWFPGIHVTHVFSPKMTLFASWTESIIRPGNPDLKPTLYLNYDIAADYDYSEDGKLSLQVFLRDIKDPTLNRTVLLTEGPFAGYDRRRPENAGEATLTGLDLTWEQDLGALGGLLDGASIEVTYTYQDSKQEVAGRPNDDLPLAREPENQLNAAFNYERGRYEVNLQAEYEGRSLQSAGRSAAEDTFVRSATRWELSLSRKTGESGRVFFEVENLTAEPEFAFEGTPSRPSGYELELREYRLGYRWEL
jgi:TonB-dependent receptor